MSTCLLSRGTRRDTWRGHQATLEEDMKKRKPKKPKHRSPTPPPGQVHEDKRRKVQKREGENIRWDNDAIY